MLSEKRIAFVLIKDYLSDFAAFVEFVLTVAANKLHSLGLPLKCLELLSSQSRRRIEVGKKSKSVLGVRVTFLREK
jgi:hypothetical protein